MSSFQRVASRVKRAPVKSFVVLFDPSQMPIRPFAGRMPRKPASIAPVAAKPVHAPTHEFTPVEMRRIDSVRREAFFDCFDLLGGKAAAEYAEEQAEEAAAHIRAMRACEASLRSRKPYTAEDLNWWFQASDEPDWDALYEERLAEDRLTSGCPC